ncbi:MAG: CRISPR-associated helicase Cas3' [Thermoguttaceae bacterium]
MFGDENVLEHHCNFERPKENENDTLPDALELAAENWDAPIIVTTNVQFFESLYSAKPRKCRKLHNVPGSVIILDEAQLIAPEYLTPCIEVLNHLSENFKTSIVLCTATQPAFSDLPDTLPKLNKTTEIVSEPQKYYEKLKRVEYHFPENLNEHSNWEEIAERIKEHQQVLCVVNTRRDCRELYELVKEYDPNVVHLSALMCAAHRSDVISGENGIKKKLEAGIKPLRVISTQLVEAGVDIDFPVVFRAMAGLDSIVQAAGRCNREGKLKDCGDVYIFVPPKPAPLGLLRKGEDTTREMLTSGDPLNFHDPEIYSTFFDLFYDKIIDSGNELVKLLTPDKNGSVYFRYVSSEFRLIDDNCTVPVIVKYAESPQLIERLRNEGPHKSLMRKLQRYTVNVPTQIWEQLSTSGIIMPLECFGKKFEIFYQSIDSGYDYVYGLDIEKSQLTAGEMVI